MTSGDRDFLLTTPHDVTADPCDNIDDLEQITVKYVNKKDEKVTTRMTNDPK
jgi:hypothetical protein